MSKIDNNKFMGYLPKYSKENELAAWKHIAKVCRAARSKYPTTYEEDVEILERDRKKKKLGVAKTNCILYRKGEKVILNYLIECAEKVERVVEMTAEEAREEVESWNDTGSIKDEVYLGYFRDTLCSLLPYSQGAEKES